MSCVEVEREVPRHTGMHGGAVSNDVVMRLRFSAVSGITEYELREGGAAIEFNMLHPSIIKTHGSFGTRHSLLSVNVTRWGQDEEGIWIFGAIPKDKNIKDRLVPLGEGKYAIGEALYVKVDDILYHSKFDELMEGKVPGSGDRIDDPWVKPEAEQALGGSRDNQND